MADPIFSAALAAHRAGRLPEAEAGYRRALAEAPDDANAAHLLGVLCSQAGRHAEGEKFIRRALAAAESAAILGNLALVLGRQEKLAEAEQIFRQALALEPHHAGNQYNLANLLKRQGRLREAEAAYRLAISLSPALAGAHRNLGELLQDAKRFAEAEAAYQAALALEPDDPVVLNDLGNLYYETGRLTEAATAYRRGLAAMPGNADLHNHLGDTLVELGQAAEAEAAYRRALTLAPDHADARYNLGLLLLSLGRFEEGWTCYEARYDHRRRQPSAVPPALPFPQWQGEPLLGKSLVVWPEQGFGDEIQFARYLPSLKRLGVVRLTLVCKPALKPLLATLAGVDRVAALGEPLEPHDYWTFALSLPRHLWAGVGTCADPLPYLGVPPERRERWRSRLPTDGKLRVGLAWKGSASHRNDAHRSLSGLADLTPLWSVPGVSFISLQKGQGEDEGSLLADRLPMTLLGQDFADFADTAAVVEQLDLVICVDTAVAHVAGALAKPCWVLVPSFETDWRWLRERADSPWYPGIIRLFRQRADGDWGTVAAEVAASLRRKLLKS